MSDALYIGATGMQAQQTQLDAIANNLVNVNTPGFKKSRVSFTDLMVAQAPTSSALGRGGEEDLLSATPRLGAGVGVASLAKVFETGAMSATGSVWDVAIQGDGFLQVQMPDGTQGFTRGGTLKVNAEGFLCTQAGHVLKPGLRIPTDATALSIGADGTVLVKVPRQAQPVQVGQLQLVRFANAGGLMAQGEGLYRSSLESGEPLVSLPGQEGLGTLQQGVLEGSNVKMVDEMVQLMLAQRTYEASVKVVQASDELMGMVNNLRK